MPVVVNGIEQKTFVLTGLFDTIPDGTPVTSTGLEKGKPEMMALLKEMGARVTSAVSKKTDFLLVGRLPGKGKIQKADTLGIKKIDIYGLGALVHGDEVEALNLKDVELSQGYKRPLEDEAPEWEAAQKRVCNQVF